MPASLRLLFPVGALVLFAATAPALAQNNDARPPTAAIPATVDVVTFSSHSDGEDQKLVVMPTPSLLRVDVPRDGLTVIYDPKTEHYTGLENRNYTYWEFSWPEVRTAVESSTRYETRLRDVGTESLNDSPPPVDPSALAVESSIPSAPETNSESSSTALPSGSNDDSGFVWQQTALKRRIAGLDCVLWTGTSLSSDPVQAWCYNGVQPAVKDALEQLRQINEPMALVPVRNLVPPFVFVINRALAKGGVTPLLMTWGEAADKNKFELVGLKTREGNISLFSVPRLYVKTTLVTMDGIGTQQPPGTAAPTVSPKSHHW